MHEPARFDPQTLCGPLSLLGALLGVAPKTGRKRNKKKKTSGCFPSLGPAEVLGRRQVRWGISSPFTAGFASLFPQELPVPSLEERQGTASGLVICVGAGLEQIRLQNLPGRPEAGSRTDLICHLIAFVFP